MKTIIMIMNFNLHLRKNYLSNENYISCNLAINYYYLNFDFT